MIKRYMSKKSLLNLDELEIELQISNKEQIRESQILADSPKGEKPLRVVFVPGR